MENLELKYFSNKDVTEWQNNAAVRFGELVANIGGRTKACQVIGNVNPDTISNWSTGKSKLPLYAACLICQASGKSIEWLVTGKEPFEKILLPEINIYQTVHEQLVQYLEIREIQNAEPATIAKLTAYLTKRFLQRKQGTYIKQKSDIDVHEFQEEITLVLGQ